MKQIVIVIWLCLWTLVPGFAQKQMDTVRAALIGVNNPEKLVFTLDDGGDTLKVRLGGKLKKIAPEFYALDVRSGDTLTVVGIRKAGNRSNKSELVSASILSIDYVLDHDERPGYYFSMDEKPSFQGGDPNTFSKWVNAHLAYPENSRRAGSEGTVLLRFIIEKNGEMGNIFILKSSGDYLLDAEAIRVVKSTPAWTPGYLHGTPAKVSFTFPVIFKLKDSTSNGRSFLQGENSEINRYQRSSVVRHRN